MYFITDENRKLFETYFTHYVVRKALVSINSICSKSILFNISVKTSNSKTNDKLGMYP